MTVTDDLPPSAPATAKGDIPVTQYSPGEYTSNASSTHQHGSGWHMWLMLACCVAPLAAILAVTVFGLQLNSVLTFAFVLLCPLMMITMMGGRGHTKS